MILKVVLCHWMGAKWRLIFVGFADYSGFVVKAHLQIKQYVFGKFQFSLKKQQKNSRFTAAIAAKDLLTQEYYCNIPQDITIKYHSKIP